MKTETLEHLFLWASRVHQHLGEQLATEARASAEGPCRGLMEYAAEHEDSMATQIAGLIPSLASEARETWLYDWLPHSPTAPSNLVDARYREMHLEQLSRSIFSVHNEIMEMLRQLAVRADVPEVEEAIRQLLDLEDGHSRQIAQQINRISDM